jgi:thiol-disulfide isomerase/thioredoxin
VSEPLPAAASASALLEYVSSSGCSDCRVFEALIALVALDYRDLEVRAVAADSARGRALSIGRGILRFPVIVLDDEILAIESITEADLRAALGRTGVDRR